MNLKTLGILLASWIFTALFTYILIFKLEVGPIIYSISIENAWGVHSGDLLALIPFIASLALTGVLRRRSKRA